jgi:hypothetical protein
MESQSQRRCGRYGLARFLFAGARSRDHIAAASAFFGIGDKVVPDMRVSSRQVRYFLALCDEQSFTRAARRCSVSQPSLTQAIRKLETVCGGPLFERSKSCIEPTKLGALVKPDFLLIDQVVADVARKVAEFHSQPRLTLVAKQGNRSCAS